MLDDLNKQLDVGTKVDMSLHAIEHLINAWRAYRQCNPDMHRSVMSKLERAQTRAAHKFHQAEQAHETMRQVEIARGWRTDGDMGFCPEPYFH